MDYVFFFVTTGEPDRTPKHYLQGDEGEKGIKWVINLVFLTG